MFRPTHGPYVSPLPLPHPRTKLTTLALTSHQLLITPQVAPMKEFLILAALQRVWALGLSGPEAQADVALKEERWEDSQEHSLW